MKVLIVEDQDSLRKDIAQYLSDKQIICEMASDYDVAQQKLAGFEYDVVLLDIMLPKGNGLDLIRLLKKRNAKSAILLLTAKGSLEDKVLGLELGADDYLAKPFHLAELAARVMALYRRTQFAGNNKIEFKEITIDLNTQQVKVHDKILVLTQKEYDLLLFFLSNKNRVLGKNTIAEHLWGDYVDALDHFDFIYQHIKNLRKKLLGIGAQAYIQNVYGMGYKFNTEGS